MKKFVLVLCCIFTLSPVVFASRFHDFFDDDFSRHSFFEKFKSNFFSHQNNNNQGRHDFFNKIKKEKRIYLKNIDLLLEKYNDADVKDKPTIKKEIKKVIAERINKDISYRREFLKKQKERINKLEKELNEFEKNKEKVINEKVKKLTELEYKTEFHEFGDGDFKGWSKTTIIKSK